MTRVKEPHGTVGRSGGPRVEDGAPPTNCLHSYLMDTRWGGYAVAQYLCIITPISGTDCRKRRRAAPTGGSTSCFLEYEQQ